MILVVAMATEVAIKFFTIIFLVLSGNDHYVKVSSNSEMGPGQLFWSSQRIGVKYYSGHSRHQNMPNTGLNGISILRMYTFR